MSVRARVCVWGCVWVCVRARVCSCLGVAKPLRQVKEIIVSIKSDMAKLMQDLLRNITNSQSLQLRLGPVPCSAELGAQTAWVVQLQACEQYMRAGR